MKYLRAISLFCRIVFRNWEDESCGIPSEYRVHYRITPKVAWDIAKGIWIEK